MQPTSIQEGVSAAFDSLLGDRLAILCGAGLSMAEPSSLPSAVALAREAKRKYDAQYGATRDPLPPGIEDQAEFFFRRGELATVYLRTLIDPNAFAGQPNPGHQAVADLLLVRGLRIAVTTNVDCMIETAGHMLFGQIGMGVDGISVAKLPPASSPLLKIHGCRTCDPDNTVWAPGQIDADPVAQRIASSERWLSANLLDKDLLVVGYWSDWDYLNAVLARTLGAARPSKVIVVDPADSATFPEKAPSLYALGQRAAAGFHHIKASGAEFLDRLRLDFSRSFVRRVLFSGRDEFEVETGSLAEPAWFELLEADNDTLWQIRRDLEGRKPREPSRDSVPPEEALLGLILLKLRAGGAVPDGPYWRLNGRLIRVLRTPNQPLHRVKADFERETAPSVAPDIVIAVGAEAYPLPSDIVRGATTPTITRGSSSRWLTRPEAVQELGL